MRILVLQNLYPPQGIGGYAHACQTAVEGLLKRGHEITVLTSRYGLSRGVVDGNMLRLLEPEPWYFISNRKHLFYRQWYNTRMFKRVINSTGWTILQ